MTSVPLFQRALPGFGHPYHRVELVAEPGGRWTVTHYAGMGVGHLTRDDVEVYGPLSWDEAVDVLEACLGAAEPA